MQIGLHLRFIRALAWFTKACLWYRIGYQLSYKQHIDLCPGTGYSAKVWSNKSCNKIHHWKEQTKFAKFTNFYQCFLWQMRSVNGQGLPVHPTTPYRNHNFKNDGAWRYFGLWLWELVRWPALSSGLFIFVFEVKLYRSCHICDKLKSIGSIQWNTSPCKSQRWSASVDKWNTGFYQLMLIKEC